VRACIRPHRHSCCCLRLHITYQTWLFWFEWTTSTPRRTHTRQSINACLLACNYSNHNNDNNKTIHGSDPLQLLLPACLPVVVTTTDSHSGLPQACSPADDAGVDPTTLDRAHVRTRFVSRAKDGRKEHHCLSPTTKKRIRGAVPPRSRGGGGAVASRSWTYISICRSHFQSRSIDLPSTHPSGSIEISSITANDNVE
jgi:hypothetical protein